MGITLLALGVLVLGDRVPPGAQVGDRRFVDTRYLRRSLAELGQRQATVLVFTTTDCLLVRRYLPRLAELERRYRPRGVSTSAGAQSCAARRTRSTNSTR